VLHKLRVRDAGRGERALRRRRKAPYLRTRRTCTARGVDQKFSYREGSRQEKGRSILSTCKKTDRGELGRVIEPSWRSASNETPRKRKERAL